MDEGKKFIVVVDYDTGNVGSVLNMLRKVGARAEVSRDPAVLEKADKLILPGVGSFDEAMRNLESFGLVLTLNRLVVEERKPILGICLGAQVMTTSSEEGAAPGLGWLNARLVRFSAEQIKLRIPHMGWNTVEATAYGGGIFNQVPAPMRFYFVHSYHMVTEQSDLILGTSNYGYQFISCLGYRNILSFQFHPEKSHKFGIRLFKNFVESFESC